MTQKVSNELKFGPDMYLYGFYQIPEDFLNIIEICQIWPKTAI